MSASELEFLEKKLQKDKARYYKMLTILGIIFISIPILGAVISETHKYFNRNASKELQQQLEYNNPLLGYVIAFFGVIVIIAAVAYFAYKKTIQKTINDIKSKQKIVEQAELIRKTHMPQNNTYHFYLDSPTRISIEVTKNDFDNYREGDEINIEYSERSKVYFGYF